MPIDPRLGYDPLKPPGLETNPTPQPQEKDITGNLTPEQFSFIEKNKGTKPWSEIASVLGISSGGMASGLYTKYEKSIQPVMVPSLSAQPIAQPTARPTAQPSQDFWLKPNETIDQYNSRIAALRSGGQPSGQTYTTTDPRGNIIKTDASGKQISTTPEPIDRINNPLAQGALGKAQGLMDEVGVVGTRKSSSLEDLINKFFKTSLPSPEPPSLTIKYQEFRDQYGLTNAESELAASQNARLELENKIASEKGKIKSTSGLTRAYVQGELISIDAQTQDALNAVMRREQNAINSVNAKQRVISEVMQYTQQNYQNTSAQYDREFNRSIQMFSLLETIKDKEHDNALASFNAFQAATKDKEFKASPAMSAQFSQWDNQLGLPLGTSEGLATFAPGWKTITQSSNTDGTFDVFQQKGTEMRTVRVGTPKAVPGKILSPSEAITLDVPYGTTESEAQAMGIQPQKPATEAQKTVAEYAARIEQSEPTLKNLTSYISGLGLTKYTIQDYLPSALQSSEFQQFNQAARNFINAKLRRESGAVISPTEFSEARKQYLPQPGDSEATLKLKDENRKLVFFSLKKAAGSAFSSVKDLLGDKTQPSEESEIYTTPDGTEYVKGEDGLYYPK